LTDAWYLGGHHTKIVLQSPNAQLLCVAKTYIETRGFRTHLVIDEGRTEIEPMSPTALGIEIVDKDDLHTAKTFEIFETYRAVRDTDVWNRWRSANPWQRLTGKF
jgi:hypothetical protein